MPFPTTQSDTFLASRERRIEGQAEDFNVAKPDRSIHHAAAQLAANRTHPTPQRMSASVK